MKKMILVITILILSLCGCSGQKIPDETPAIPDPVLSEDNTGQVSPFTLQMLDVGQGLCLLIESDGHYMMYDGGGRDHSSFVVSYLTKQIGIDHIDLMIASHYDEDHIAGLIGVMNTMPVDQVLCPDYSRDTQIYQSFMDTATEKDISLIHPSDHDRFDLGDAKIEIVSDGAIISESDNDHAIACTITYGKTKIIVTGDCEEAAELAMINDGQSIRSDIYVAGHHGSATSSSEAFLQSVSPKDVLISCGAGNTYGHPAESMLERIASVNADIYRTDKQGTIILHADKKSYWFDQEPCEDWTPGVYVEQTKEAPVNASEYKYILNTNSKLIHKPDCDSVLKMSEKNKEYTNTDINRLEEAGYRPCHNCNPE